MLAAVMFCYATCWVFRTPEEASGGRRCMLLVSVADEKVVTETGDIKTL